MAVIITRPNPWCPDCHQAQMEREKTETVKDDRTQALCSQETWRCPKCDTACSDLQITTHAPP